MNYGTVRRTDDAVISEQPVLSFSSRSLTVGGAVGCNSGGTVQKIAVVTSFKDFTGYKYLGGVTGENAAEGTVTGCSFSGEISQNTSASTGNCYGGIVGRNNARLTDDEVSDVTIDVTGVYTATATSTAAQKEELSAHIGGVAGKNDSEGEISGCVIRSTDSASSSIKVDYGMVGRRSRLQQRQHHRFGRREHGSPHVRRFGCRERKERHEPHCSQCAERFEQRGPQAGHQLAHVE